MRSKEELHIKKMALRNIAKKVFEIEANEISKLSSKLTADFDNSVESILSSKGKLIISGMGKSGIVGKKIAATLASTGTSSFFLHPGEAYHGDLGMIGAEDVVLLISNSGETDEVLKLIPFLKSQGNITISMSGNPSSTLAKNTQYHLDIGVDVEACPLQLAPTSSTTATIVMGDALAVALMEKRGFKAINFAKFHPGGSLGKRLLNTVEDVMKNDDLPVIKLDDSIKKIIQQITAGRVGLAVVTSNSEKNIKIEGVISDGDVRRAMEENEENFFLIKAQDLMTRNPITVKTNCNLSKASDIMNKNKINSLLVIDERESLKGIVQFYDLGI